MVYDIANKNIKDFDCCADSIFNKCKLILHGLNREVRK